MALGKAAPASSRAQHMRSHIYMRFGNWSQVVESNTVGRRAAWARGAAGKPGRCWAVLCGAHGRGEAGSCAVE